MSNKTYPITGIPLVPGQKLPTRQEITDWLRNDTNQYQVSLFMQALTEFKKKPVEERLSYFQIAGIHCYPLVGWDGEEGVKTRGDTSNPFPGYCAHNTITFPTWHRPYMLLYEQVLYETMVQMIQDWKVTGRLSNPAEEETWRSAASQFRLPYWDWARKQVYTGTFGVPQVCTLDYINIIMPGGQRERFLNPLVKFQNPKLNEEGQNVAMGDKSMGENAICNHNPNPKDDPFKYNILPWSKCVATSRYGILEDPHHGLGPEPDWVNGVNNWEYCNEALTDPQWYKGDGGSLADAVSRMLSSDYFDSWETFASAEWNSPKTNKDYPSIEYIHNVIHNITGGQYMSKQDIDEGSTGFLGLGLGHMADVPVAAFDPIFWLHHCNIDRLLAIWQTLNWKKWFDKLNPKKTLPLDPLPSDPLLPFHYDTEKNTWSSDRARNWQKLNYQYDDLVTRPHTPEDSPKYLEDLRNHINELYPSTSSIVQETPGYTLPDQEFHDYIINVVYGRYALGGLAYTILFFIGKPPKHLSSYRQSKNFVGAVYTFSSPVENPDGSAACENCAQQSAEKVLSKAQIPITLPLLSKATQPRPSQGEEAPQLPVPGIGLGALDPDTVEAFLNSPHEGLSWEFVALGGNLLDRSEFPNTEIAVLHGTGTHATKTGRLPGYQNYSILKEAASNQFLGFGHRDTNLHLIRNDPGTA